MSEQPTEATRQETAGACCASSEAGGAEAARREESLEEVRDRYLRDVLDLVLKGSHYAFWDWHGWTSSIRVDAVCADILGGSRESRQWTETGFLARVHPDDRDRVRAQARALFEGECAIARIEFRMRTLGGSWVWVLVSGKVVACDRAGRAECAVGTIVDADLLRRGEERLYRMANFDVLTGLPNRTLLEDRLSRALLTARRSARAIAMMFVSLDRFRNVNDSLGHAAGDDVLRTVAARLAGAVCESGTVARIGGDEFAIVLPDCGEVADVARVAARLRQVVEARIAVGNRALHLGASIGISMYTHDAHDRMSLMRNASAAMHHAKESGGGFQFFCLSMHESAERRLGLESDLRHALASGEFRLHYQPRVNLVSGKVAGLEALLRWNRPGGELLPPEDFIALSEDTGLIVGIGEWVLREACRQAAEWRRRCEDLCVSVNISARQLRGTDIPILVRDVLAESRIDPRALELEITENALLERTEDVLRTLNRIAELGVRFSVDDFGTGYSSLGCLRRMPLAAVKIDRSFVQGAANDAGDAAILRAMVGIADSLRLEVVAEGVETSGQLDTVRDLGCVEAQGYFFSAPLEPAQAAQFLRQAA
jgi:diguanylate cyclase (GGDEF)-like protein